MTGAIVLTTAVMGLAATPHCAGMCAGACAASLRACGSGGRRQALGALLTGRIASYATAGFLAASTVAAVRWVADAQIVLRPLWAMAQAALLVLGVWLLARGRVPLWLDRAVTRPGLAGEGKPPHSPGALTARAGLIGLAWVAVPCGLLHAAVLVSAMASSPAEGALAMAAFGLTSTAGLAGGQRLWRWLGAARAHPAVAASAGQPISFVVATTTASAAVPVEPARAAAGAGAWSLRLAGLTLVLAAGWSIWHLLLAPLGALC